MSETGISTSTAASHSADVGISHTVMGVCIAFAAFLAYLSMAIYLRGRWWWQDHCKRCHRRIKKGAYVDDQGNHDQSDSEHGDPCEAIWWEMPFLISRHGENYSRRIWGVLQTMMCCCCGSCRSKEEGKEQKSKV